MDEGDQRAFGSLPRLLVDEPHTPRFQPRERGADVVNAKRDVMNAGTALRDVFRDRRIARRSLEQLDRCLSDNYGDQEQECHAGNPTTSSFHRGFRIAD